jgi:glioma pathogenesis-related protein 2
MFPSGRNKSTTLRSKSSRQLSSCSGAPDPFRDTLAKHNNYRFTHQAPDMTWDATLAAAANTYASTCTWAYDANRGNNIGENLFGASSFTITSLALSQSVDVWYDEIMGYSLDSPGYSSETGDFTQVVWAGSLKVGCGYASCGDTFVIPNGIIVVCRYSPAGNIAGAFAENVLAPAGSVPAYVACAIGASVPLPPAGAALPSIPERFLCKVPDRVSEAYVSAIAWQNMHRSR